jgi:hypothetical protein
LGPAWTGISYILCSPSKSTNAQPVTLAASAARGLLDGV